VGGLKGWPGVNSGNTCCNGVYGHPCGGRCGDRWTASHEYEVAMSWGNIFDGVGRLLNNSRGLIWG